MGGLDDPTKSVLEIALPALVGFKPVSHCTWSPRMGDVGDAARRAPASDARQRGRAPGAGLRHAKRARERKNHRGNWRHARRARASPSEPRARQPWRHADAEREREHAITP